MLGSGDTAPDIFKDWLSLVIITLFGLLKIFIIGNWNIRVKIVYSELLGLLVRFDRDGKVVIGSIMVIRVITGY